MYDFYILFFIVAFLSIIIGTVAGFGTSTIFLPVALFFVDFKTALVLVCYHTSICKFGGYNIFSPWFR